MTQLTPRLHWPARAKAAQLAVEPAVTQARSEASVQEPSLILLVDDAAGPAARRLHSFENCHAAADFIRFWFPPERRHGLIAFWALREEPDPASGAGGPAEAVILVRDAGDPELVFPFSFAGMEPALSFIHDEAQAGLDLAQVLLYWAAPVTIDTADPDAVRFSPSTPPLSARREAGAAPPLEPQSELEPEPAPEPVPIADSPAHVRRGRPEPQPVTADELLLNVVSVLRARRWQRRDEAFSGFGSPPGRF